MLHTTNKYKGAGLFGVPATFESTFVLCSPNSWRSIMLSTMNLRLPSNLRPDNKGIMDVCYQQKKEWASQCPGKITRIPQPESPLLATISASAVPQDEPQKSQGQRFYFVRTLNVKKKQFSFVLYQQLPPY